MLPFSHWATGHKGKRNTLVQLNAKTKVKIRTNETFPTSALSY